MHIAILTGGISNERTVALRSGDNMRVWCITAGHTVDIYDCPTTLIKFIEKYKTYDLVIPVFHGVYGEDGQITAFLKTLGCRYAYSDFEVHGLCIDKNLTNMLVEKIQIRIPKTIFLKKGEVFEGKDIYFPLIVKPNKGGSSLGTYRVKDQADLANAIKEITDDDILIQDCIEGKEFTVGVYKDRDGYNTLPVMEIITRDNVLFDYHEKYETDGYNELFLTGEDELQKKLQEESVRICEYIGTRGIVRLDWRYDGKDVYFLEVNTIPGFTSGSFVPKMWKQAGKTEEEFINMLGL